MDAIFDLAVIDDVFLTMGRKGFLIFCFYDIDNSFKEILTDKLDKHMNKLFHQ